MVDRELLERYAGRRDAEAFAELVRGYQGLVYATCRRGLYCQDDLDDAVQETFLRLARKAGEIRSNVGAWLHRCAMNVALDLNRRRHTRQRHEAAVGVAADAVGSEQRELAELREQVDAALARLEEEQRELIIQRYFVGRTMAELARQHGVTPSAMTYRLEKAVGALRAQLEAMGCAAGVGGVVAMLEGEGSIQVPSALTANVMKIGLKGVGMAGVGMMGAMGAKIGLAAAGLLVAGSIWLAAQARPATTQVAATRPASPVALIEQPGGAVAVTPKWDTAAPATSAALSGRILDEAGKPVAGAKVTLSGPGNPRNTTTDKDGQYSFATVDQDGEYQIEVVANGFVKRTQFGLRQEEPIRLNLSKAAEARRDVVLERGTTVVVTVLDAQGNPIPRATVAMGSQVTGAQSWQEQVFARKDTDRDGLATETLPSGKTYVVAAVQTGLAPSHQVVTLEKGEDLAEVELALTPGYQLRGVVICSDGKPATGYEIELSPGWWTGGRSPSWGRVKLNDRGEFVLPVSEGENSALLWNTHSGHGIGKVQIPTTQEVVRLRAPVVSKGSLNSIQGQVQLDGKRPEQSGVIVWAHAPGMMSAEMAWVDFGAGDSKVGRYEIKDVASGEYTLRFESAETESKMLEHVKIPGEVPLVELKVRGKTRLSGQVVDAMTGKPLTQFAIRVPSQDPGWTQVAHADGRFSIDLNQPGEYRAQISAAGYARAWTEAAAVAAGQSTQLLVKMTPGGSLAGRVVDEAGKAVVGAKVRAYCLAQRERYEARQYMGGSVDAVTTDEQGEYILPHLQAGDTQVAVAHSDFVSRVVQTKVTDAQSTQLEPTVLIEGGTVEGTVYGADGRPAAGMHVRVDDAEDTTAAVEVTTDEQGRYRVIHRPERPTHVTVTRPDGFSMWQLVRPLNGRTTEVKFPWELATVSGRLLDGDAPMAERDLTLESRNARSYGVYARGKTDARGNFAIGGIPYGEYVLSVVTETDRGLRMPARELAVAGAQSRLGDVKTDLATVEIAVVSDDPGELKAIMDVAAGDSKRRWTVTKVGDVWRTAAVTTELELRATYRVENAVLMYSMPCTRGAGKKTVQVTMRLPSRSAMLQIPALDGSGNRPTALWLEREDGSVRISTGLESKAAKVIAVPPGTYFVRDPNTDRRNERVPPIVLEEGKTTVIPVESVRAPRCVMVYVAAWTAGGLAAEDVQLKVCDAGGVEVARDEQWTTRWAWNLPPGKYQAKVEAHGKVLTREVVVTPELAASETPAQYVDVFLSEP